MRRDPVRLSRRHRVWLYATCAVLFFTGIIWLILHRWGNVEGDFGLQPNPAQPWLLRIHGAAALISLVIFGSLIPLHIKRAWKAGRNIPTGSSIVFVTLLLIVTGYGLYYASGERLRDWASWTHRVVGIGFPLVLVWHIAVGRKLRHLRRVNLHARPEQPERKA